MNTVVKSLCDCSLQEAFQKYGLEGTEEVINRLYQNNPRMFRFVLLRYQRLIRQSAAQ